MVGVIWDTDDDPQGNVQHITEHGITPDEVDEVIQAEVGKGTTKNRSSGNPIVFGWTATGKHLAVVYERVDDNPLRVYPITAYEAPPPRKKR